ncbi:MAG: DUF465 domain-containing protein [Candidatus Aminicenantes bacterium]|nr:DUF465 domain-containing protein [Candidatus Aminicenantes bacterium]
MEEDKIKERLLKENEEFRKAYEEHQKHEKALRIIGKKPYLTEEDQIKEKNIKKQKLALKDKMYYLIDQYKKTHK